MDGELGEGGSGPCLAAAEEVRTAGPGDLDVLVSLAGEMTAELRPMRGGGIWSVREARRAPLAGAFAALLADPDARVVIGTIDGVAVGFGVGTVEVLADATRLGVVAEIFVTPGARAIGVGEAMLGELVRFLDDRGCVGVDAFALPGHRAAKNFFEENAFVARAIVMHRSLAADGDDPDGPSRE